LPREKTLAQFERGRLKRAVERQLAALLDGEFLDRRENVLVFGNPGSGKTHLLCALGHELVGQGRAVYFVPCVLLVQRLLLAKAELWLEKELRRLDRIEALIIDDIGYVQQSREEMEVLFTLLAHRYEHRSVLLTSNLIFSQWEQIFKDPMTTAAAIDRLVHHSVILELNLTSYRMAAAQKQHGALKHERAPEEAGGGGEQG
jgi:DNA replication protein DnaC